MQLLITNGEDSFYYLKVSKLFLIYISMNFRMTVEWWLSNGMLRYLQRAWILEINSVYFNIIIFPSDSESICKETYKEWKRKIIDNIFWNSGTPYPTWKIFWSYEWILIKILPIKSTWRVLTIGAIIIKIWAQLQEKWLIEHGVPIRREGGRAENEVG